MRPRQPRKDAQWIGGAWWVGEWYYRSEIGNWRNSNTGEVSSQPRGIVKHEEFTGAHFYGKEKNPKAVSRKVGKEYIVTIGGRNYKMMSKPKKYIYEQRGANE